MLTSSAMLSERLSTLDNDIGMLPGRRLALFGFRDTNAKRVAENVAILQAAKDWTIVDVRQASKQLNRVVAAAIGAPKLVLLIDVESPLPVDFLLLLRSIHDSRDAVRWSDGTDTPLPRDRIVYVVAIGARSVEDLPRPLASIDFMEFLKPPGS